MESGAKDCKVMVSGKFRGQRVKSMNYYIDTAMHHVLLRQAVLGVKLKIMLPWDPSGKTGSKKPLPDHVSTVEPKDEILPTTSILEQKKKIYKIGGKIKHSLSFPGVPGRMM
uniref:Ribosomal protein S3 C-terminal domain-containing protein n=1 Tax=Cavia porcellus TaxID=10141 RepID=A0A286XV65_CAVPO